LGEKIGLDYAGLRPVLVGILRGAFVFMADLARAIPEPVEIDFMGVESYGDRTYSTGVVRIVRDLSCTIEGRHVLVVEDIVDTGQTLSYLLDNLRTRRPASLKVCALLNKKERRVIPVPVEYIGFDIPDRFVVGYGLDYNQERRNLPYITILREVEEREQRKGI
jgi:hypoxanthine phosphoribosyltransferase